MINPLISIVIPAYNCEKTIQQTLEAVIHQLYQNIDIIVVDDGSSDQTAQIVKTFSEVRYFYQTNSGPAVARNLGAQEARGEIIFFTDSDCIPNEDWIQAALPHFSDQNVAVVAGGYDIANPKNLLSRCIHKEIQHRHHKYMPQYPKAFGSYNFGIRKNVFQDVGGFDGAYRFASGEDNDLSYKVINLGKKICFEQTSLVKHFHTTKIIKYLKEQFRHGYWRVKMYKNHPHMMKGDDYTHYKDIVEIPLVYLCLILFFLNFFFDFSFGVLVVILLVFLFGWQVCYSYVTTKNFFETIFFSFVLFLRAFARAFGFSSGIPLLFGK